jgi:hypothetical protein
MSRIPARVKRPNARPAPSMDSPASVIPISEVTPSRGVRALEGEGRGLSHLEVIARGGCGAS